MSHTATIKTSLTDESSIRAACREMGLPEPTRETVRMFDGASAEGICVRLPGWDYPVVIDRQGQAKYDNYNGAWGKQEHLNRFTQLYAVHRATATAQRQGYQVARIQQANGGIRLNIRVP